MAVFAVFESFGKIPLLEIDYTQFEVGLCIIGVERDDYFEMADGPVQIFIAIKDIAKVFVDVPSLLVDGEGTFEMADGPFQVPFVSKDDAEVVVGISIIGVERDGFFEMPDGIFQVPLGPKGIAEGGVGQRKVGIQIKSFAQCAMAPSRSFFSFRAMARL